MSLFLYVCMKGWIGRRSNQKIKTLLATPMATNYADLGLSNVKLPLCIVSL